ncbi:MAG: hydroxymethylbilane synthase [candidate division Zixibacteria bacterium]|nr:hydroxymethylbilane synthase [candidate division KSB1 bacterium]NIR65568.1 hydroxymethylbilane synthase [candidate division Zixibacteria bacterium]NIS47257.1 hydroxymethylbilane synthase [candidate division Zixibacteria bacterium]NIV07463.1 hydroxymethylbilane synthase [candidate division Zixibacteria bacterium]NIW70986.1 hydroxymethylbilane synthase [candidate division KSB1 bacterium]
MRSRILIGTRGSELALWQANWVNDQLVNLYPQFNFDIKTVKTSGDKILDVPLAKIGGKALFTKEIDNALIHHEIDIAVHSLKDVPTQIPNQLIIGAITQRADVRDALISRGDKPLSQFPQGASIATGSLRRRSLLLHYRPDFQLVDIRGNLNSRFRKFDEADWEGMVLAVAGIKRMGWEERISEKVSLDIILPAVGQGSFAVICRKDDAEMLEILAAINHRPAELATRAERAMLRTLEGGCQVPIGAYGEVENDNLKLTGSIGSLDGKETVRDCHEGDAGEPENIGHTLAQKLLEQGGERILEAVFSEQRS